MPCHIHDLHEGVGDVEECHFINKRKMEESEAPLLTAWFVSPRLQLWSKSHQPFAQLVRATLAEPGTPSPESLQRAGER